jgi:hypothetical protein
MMTNYSRPASAASALRVTTIYGIAILGVVGTPVLRQRHFQELERRRKQSTHLFAAGKMILAAIAPRIDGKSLRIPVVVIETTTEIWRQWGPHAGRVASRGWTAMISVPWKRAVGTNGFWRERWNLRRRPTVTERAMEARYSSRSFLVGLPCGKEQSFTANHPRSKDLAGVN